MIKLNKSHIEKIKEFGYGLTIDELALMLGFKKDLFREIANSEEVVEAIEYSKVQAKLNSMSKLHKSTDTSDAQTIIENINDLNKKNNIDDTDDDIDYEVLDQIIDEYKKKRRSRMQIKN